MSVFTRCLFLFFSFCLSVFVVVCVVRGSLYTYQTMDIEVQISAASIVVVVATLLSYIVMV